MALPITGLQFVAQGLGTFLTGVNSATKGVQEFYQQAGKSVGSLSGFNTVTGQAASAVNYLIHRLLVLGAVYAATSTIKEWIKLGFDQVVMYDRMSLSVQALIARDLIQAGATKDFGEAMRQAAPQAKALLDWTQQLAVVSIFESQDIRHVQVFAQATGIAADQAQIMTASISAWGTVTGQTEQTLSNVTNALTDMFTKGRVQSEEMRQLARNGIPAWEFLADALGVTTAKLREMVTKGLVPADVGIKAIVDGMSKQYGPALKEFAFSAAGITSSLQDLKKIALREFFTGTFQAIQPYLERFVSVLMQPETLATIRGWGDALGSVASKFFGFAEAVIASGDPLGYLAVIIDKIVPGFYGLYDAISTAIGTFANLAKEAFGWGEGIGIQFAQGIIAAITYIVQAINYIGQVLASWLAPGSPPKVAPDLPEWGAAAAQEWIGGFSKANMSDLKDLAGSIKDVLQNAVSSGGMSEEGVIPALLGGEDVLAKAITEMEDLGDVSAETLSQVYDWASKTSPEIVGLVDAFFDWERASQAVKQAQEELDEINQKFADTLSPLNKELKENEKQQKRLRDLEKLRKLEEKIAEGKASPNEVKLAQLEKEQMQIQDNIDVVKDQQETETEAAQKRLDDAKVLQDAALAEYESKKAQIDLQREHNNLIAEQVKLLERIAKQQEADAKKAAGGGGGGFGAPKGEPMPSGPLNLGTGILDDIKDSLDAFKKKADEARASWAKIRKEFDDSKASIKGVSDKIAPLSDLAGGIGLAFGSLAVGGIVSFVLSLFKAITPLGLLITGATLLYKAWTTNFMGIQEVVGGVVTYIQGLVEDYIPTQKEFGDITKTVSDGVKTAWSDTILPAFEKVGEFVKTELGPVLGDLATALIPLVIAAGQLLASIWTNAVVPAGRLLWSVFTELIWPVIKVVAGVITDLLIPALTATVAFISTNVLPIFKDVFGFINDSLIPLVKEIARVVTEIFLLAWRSLVSYWTDTLFPTVSKLYNDHVLPLIAKFSGPGSLGEGLGKIKEGFEYAVGVVDDFIKSLGGLKGIIDSVIKWLHDLADTIALINVPPALVQHSPSPMEKAINAIGDSLLTLNMIAQNIGNIWANLYIVDGLENLTDAEKKYREEQIKLLEDLPTQIRDVGNELTDFLREMRENFLNANIGSFDVNIGNLQNVRDAFVDIRHLQEDAAEKMAKVLEDGQKDAQDAAEKLADAIASGNQDAIDDALKLVDTVTEANRIALEAAQAEKDAADAKASRLTTITDQEEKDLEAARQKYLQMAQAGDVENAEAYFELRSKQIKDIADLDRQISNTTDARELGSLENQRAFLIQQQQYELQLFDSQAQHRVDTVEESIQKIADAFNKIKFPDLPDGLGDLGAAFMQLVDLMGQLSLIQLPDWLTPGSPTPLEIGLRGITNAVRQLSTTALPPLRVELGKVSGMMSPTQMLSTAYNNNYTDARQYNLATMTNNSPQQVYQSFEIMRSMY